MSSEVLNLPGGLKRFLTHVVLQQLREGLRRRSSTSNMLRTTSGLFLFMTFWVGLPWCVSAAPATENGGFEFRSAVADREDRAIQANSVNLGSHPTQITFGFGQRTNNLSAAMRVRYRLEGYEERWHDSPSQMFVAVRFYNTAGEQVGQKIFGVDGDSVGWRHSLETSPLAHRRESVTCPPGTEHFWVVISSAGPPAAVGIYVIANLNVAKVTSNGTLVPVMPPLDDDLSSSPDGTVRNWRPDGGRPSMAKVVAIGKNPSQKALAIVDTDGATHAEWHNAPNASPRALPGDQLLLEWNEMYCIGVSDMKAAHYDSLPAGKYVLRVEYFDFLGRPSGIKALLNVIVPPPLWLQPAFWLVVGIALIVLITSVLRYWTSRRIRRELDNLKWQRALEQERLRIARDIHDHLGARLTEVSLASALAKSKHDLAPTVAEDFDQISTMCRDLVTALYATVWTVNPKNDNLHALGEFLCQIGSRLCDQAQMACRLEVPGLPQDIEISSGDRHNIAMSVTEAVNNTVKHAKASELCLKVGFESGVLVILVEDDGCGFDQERASTGNGLNNMRDRLASIGGNCSIESKAGRKTTIRMQVPIRNKGLRGNGE
jgi:signal transduction histidine kinase